jgi:hypothetical protein
MVRQAGVVVASANSALVKRVPGLVGPRVVLPLGQDRVCEPGDSQNNLSTF